MHATATKYINDSNTQWYLVRYQPANNAEDLLDWQEPRTYGFRDGSVVDFDGCPVNSAGMFDAGAIRAIEAHEALAALK